jgi:hypothetical protein
VAILNAEKRAKIEDEGTGHPASGGLLPVGDCYLRRAVCFLQGAKKVIASVLTFYKS